jgi:hypothetical protein
VKIVPHLALTGGSPDYDESINPDASMALAGLERKAADRVQMLPAKTVRSKVMKPLGAGAKLLSVRNCLSKSRRSVISMLKFSTHERKSNQTNAAGLVAGYG